LNQGLYTAYLGMRARQQALDTVADNIANSSTTGFKAAGLTYSSVEEGARVAPAPSQATGSNDDTSSGASTATRSRTLGVVAYGLTDHASGALRQTDAPLDLALAGDGYFVIQTARGERFTRAGSFTLNADGQLVTQGGDLVEGDGGPLTLPPGEVSVGDDGSISVAGREVGRLRVARFANPASALSREGANLFAATGAEQPSEAASTRVVQGTLESSNVNPIAEMSAMIEAGREFDSLQRSVTLQMNDLGRKVANEIGRI
jgi:flagellar basal-body rod protein FlgF